jgi:hypothetical protein
MTDYNYQYVEGLEAEVSKLQAQLIQVTCELKDAQRELEQAKKETATWLGCAEKLERALNAKT